MQADRPMSRHGKSFRMVQDTGGTHPGADQHQQPGGGAARDIRMAEGKDHKPFIVPRLTQKSARMEIGDLPHWEVKNERSKAAGHQSFKQENGPQMPKICAITHFAAMRGQFQ